MTVKSKTRAGMLGAVFSAAAIAGCSSNKAAGIDPSRFATPLDRHPIGVREQTVMLELPLAGPNGELSEGDTRRLREFFIDYTRKGHGLMVVATPQSPGERDAAVAGAMRARELAFELGIEYSEVEGGVFDADADGGAPLVVAYNVYEAVAPDCPTLAEQDLADFGSNSELSSFGCVVNANIAAMIAEPGDLLGQRPLDEGDVVRRRIQFELYREGQPTGSARAEGESGAVSNAVN
ncbi:MAG: CpaD family pilus assembly protein [Pseudomonadota bacterium]